MVVRRLVAFAGAAAVAVAVALPATSAYAALPSDVYVATPGNGGNDANDCSQGNPCAAVGAAVQAVADLGTIHVGVGVFDGPIRPNAVNKSVTIDGASSGDTTVTNSGLDGFVVEVDSHTTTLSNLTASGGLASTVLVTGVTFRSGSQVLCQDVTVASGAASCTTSALAAGSRSVTAAFTPAAGSTLHASVSAARTIKVGIPPAFTSRSHTTFRVGKRKTFTVRASGSPGPRITLVKGKLPAGLHFDAGRGTATVSGKARGSGVGTHRVTLRASNLRGTVHQVLRIVVKR
jgi:hypothetical protein